MLNRGTLDVVEYARCQLRQSYIGAGVRFQDSGFRNAVTAGPCSWAISALFLAS